MCGLDAELIGCGPIFGDDKEIRLSFAQRIKGTLPAPYQQLITEEKEKDTPDFKYNNEGKSISSYFHCIS